VSNWIAACERIIALDPQVIVPGHGPPSETSAVRELKAYFEYLYGEARRFHEQRMTPLQAARALSLDRWADWGESERLVVNLANIYAELDGDVEPLNPLVAFQQMAELSAAH
jgi:cyclase